MKRLLALGLLAACSDDSSGVAVHTARGGTPLAGVHVHFFSASHALLSSEVTDDHGDASSSASGRTTVTIVMPQEPRQGFPLVDPWITTIIDVESGDSVTIDDPIGSAGATTLVYSFPKDPGATSYRVHTSCEPYGFIVQDAGTDRTEHLSTCTPSGPIYVVSESATPHALVADASPTNGMLALTGSYQPLDEITLAVAGATQAQWSLQSASYNSDDLGFGVPNAIPPLHGEVDLVAESLGQGEVVSMFSRARSLGDVPDSIDFAPATALARIENLELDLLSHTINWTSTAGETPDFIYVGLDARRDTMQWRHGIYAPYAAGTLAVPALPREDAVYNIGAADANDGFSVSGTYDGGYRQLVTTHALRSSPDATNFRPALGKRAILIAPQ